MRIADLSEASCDPLARKVRYRLRHEHGIVDGLAMVLSTEKPRCGLISVDELTHEPHELQVLVPRKRQGGSHRPRLARKQASRNFAFCTSLHLLCCLIVPSDHKGRLRKWYANLAVFWLTAHMLNTSLSC